MPLPPIDLSDGPGRGVGWRVTLLAALPVLALYVLVGGSSPGFDDEVYTLRIAYSAPDVAGVLHYLETEDVHPPLSYLSVWAWVQAGLDPATLRGLIGAVNALALAA